MASKFAEVGYDVLVAYHRDADGAAEAASAVKDRGRDALVMQANVCVWDDVVAMVDAAIDRWDHLDCLVNNAGGAYRWAGPEGTPLIDLDEEAWDATIDLN